MQSQGRDIEMKRKREEKPEMAVFTRTAPQKETRTQVRCSSVALHYLAGLLTTTLVQFPLAVVQQCCLRGIVVAVQVRQCCLYIQTLRKLISSD